MTEQQLDLNFLPKENEILKQYENKDLELPPIQEMNESSGDEDQPSPESLNYINNDLHVPPPQQHMYQRPQQFRDEPAPSLSSYAGSDLTPEEEERKKKQLLYKLKRFQRKGFSLSRAYNLDSNLIDIQSEFESIKREANLNASVETMKKGLSVGAYTLEMVNTKFNPIGAKLEGWSSQIKDDLQSGDFDEIFEDLYDKYTDSIAMPPEMRLLSMLATSALQYHIAQVIVNNTLTRDRSHQILKENPNLKRTINQAVKKNIKTKNLNKKMKMPSDLGGIMEEIGIEDNIGKSLFEDDEKMDAAIVNLNF